MKCRLAINFFIIKFQLFLMTLWLGDEIVGELGKFKIPPVGKLR